MVDQAEEAFTMVQDEAEPRAFFERLASLAQQNGAPLYVLVTLHAEFLGDAAPYAELRQLLQAHQELVAPMDAGELRGAMEQQARAVGLRFEADLANTLLDDVAGEPGAMPLLQARVVGAVASSPWSLAAGRGIPSHWRGQAGHRPHG